MFWGAGIFNVFNTISVFPMTCTCHLSGISGSVTGLATNARACVRRIFHMIFPIQDKMLRIGQHGFLLYILILPSIYQPTNALKNIEWNTIHKIQILASIKLLHVLMPECHH
jgi:hypothetical protein